MIKSQMPEVAEKVSVKILPNFIVKFGALFNARAREGVVFLKMNRRVSNEKAKNLLGWQPIGLQEETILAAVGSMIKFDLIK